MFRFLLLTLIAFAQCLCATQAKAQAGMPVYVESSAPDPVGKRLVYAIREGIRRSSSMSLEDREKDGFISVRVVTLNPDDGSTPVRTIYSVVWTTKTLHDTPVTMYLTNSVGLCGSAKVAECADGLVADTDEQASFVRSILRSIVDQNK